MGNRSLLPHLTFLRTDMKVSLGICNFGEMDHSDAQDIVKAKEMQGEDPLQYAWDKSMTPEQAAEYVLKVYFE